MPASPEPVVQRITEYLDHYDTFRAEYIADHPESADLDSDSLLMTEDDQGNRTSTLRASDIRAVLDWLAATASLTADVMPFAYNTEGQLCVLLIRRGAAPFKGQLAFPGGYVDAHEPVDTAAYRELKEETSLSGNSIARFHELGTWSTPGRDPRGRTSGTVFVALMDGIPEAVAGDDAAGAFWVPVEDLVAVDSDCFHSGTVSKIAVDMGMQMEDMAFDHGTGGMFVRALKWMAGAYFGETPAPWVEDAVETLARWHAEVRLVPEAVEVPLCRNSSHVHD